MLAHILTIPFDTNGFQTYSDASVKDLDYVLNQHNKVIVYASRQLKVQEKNYPTYDLELIVIIFCIRNLGTLLI